VNPVQVPAAVLFDMDGTLVDTEKVWDITLDETAAWLGGRLSAAARAAMVGANLATSVALLHADLQPRDVDPERTAGYLTARTAERFAQPLPWRAGAAELLAAVVAAGIPTALVTNTRRKLVDLALRTIGAGNFDVVVCGDEVLRPKPHPEPYLMATRTLGVDPVETVAVEDSPIGVESAEAAGCGVLAVPSELPLLAAPGRVVRRTLVGVTIGDLAAIVRLRQSRAS
jgi:HAD superfamily hydrolase (TIGR01509 family)